MGWIRFSLLALVLTSQVCTAKVVGLFDIDGTLNNDKGSSSAWRTPWLLKRLDHMHSLFQQSPNKPIEVELTDAKQIAYYNQRFGTHHDVNTPVRVAINLPQQIAVSYDEYSKYQELWAKSETVAGALKPILLDYDPLRQNKERLIIPGYFRIFDLTFKYYRERSGGGKNYIVQDYEQGKQRVQALGAPFEWKGRAFALFQAFMAHPETVLNAQRFTSRGHRSEEYWQWDDHMVADGEIAFATGPDGKRPIVHSLSQPEARIYGQSLVEKKVQVVKGAAEALFRTTAPKHKELAPDAERAAQGIEVETHTVIVAEDEPSYVAAIANYMVNLSGSYFADRIKLVLFNTGSDEEVAQSRFPWRWTVITGRDGRPATEAEIQKWHEPKQLDGDGCETRLTSEAP